MYIDRYELEQVVDHKRQALVAAAERIEEAAIASSDADAIRRWSHLVSEMSMHSSLDHLFGSEPERVQHLNIFLGYSADGVLGLVLREPELAVSAVIDQLRYTAEEFVHQVAAASASDLDPWPKLMSKFEALRDEWAALNSRPEISAAGERVMLVTSRDYASLTTRDIPAGPYPSFFVVTGMNGSGKTHLLQAIAEGAISLGTHDVGRNMTFIAAGKLAEPIPASEVISPMPSDEWVSLQADIRDISDQDGRNWVAERTGVGVAVLLAAEGVFGKPLKEFGVGEWERIAPLPPAFSPFDNATMSAMSLWRMRERQNKLANALAGMNERPAHPPLTDGDFARLYGPPPWEVLNEALAALGVSYRAEQIELKGVDPKSWDQSATSGVLTLTDVTTGAPVSPTQLSTGEQVLFRVCFALFQDRSSDSYRWPRALLLDEPDAYLHPSMVRALIDFLRQLAARHHITVIVTTHSPTTVALAPEGAVYEMRRSATPKLRPTTRDAALVSLSAGVPLLAISVECRRIVMVEDESDVKRYSDIVRAAYPKPLHPERTLEFLSAGGKAGTTGSAAVRDRVEMLRGAGNRGVWGIIDRDTNNPERDFILVADTDRYSIENLIYDPLSLGCLLLLDGKWTPESLGLAAGSTMTTIDIPAVAQTISDAVCNTVFPDSLSHEKRAVPYEGGFTTEIPVDWLDTSGHALEGKDRELGLIQEAIPEFREYGVANHRGDRWSRAVVERLWRTFPVIVPARIGETFRRILDAPY